MPARKTKREDGRFQVNAYLGRDENGKRVQKVFYGATQKEAQAKKKAFLDGIALSRDAKRMTLRRWSEEWLNKYASGGYRNQENNASIIRVFLRELGRKADAPISEIIPADIQGYARVMSTHTKSHVSKVKRTVEAVFKTAKENGFIVSTPCEGTVWDSVKTGTHEAVSSDMDELILNNWRVHAAGIWAMLIRYAGLRPSEAFALDRSSISEDSITVTNGSHYEHGQLVITEGITKSDAGQRTVPILSPLRPVIEAMPREGLVCRSATGKPVSQSAYKRNWTTFQNMLEDAYNGIEPRLTKRTDCLPEGWKKL